MVETRRRRASPKLTPELLTRVPSGTQRKPVETVILLTRAEAIPPKQGGTAANQPPLPHGIRVAGAVFVFD